MQYVTFKNWSAALILWLPALAFAGSSGSSSDATQRSYTWMDESHSYATNQAQALTEWMDSFFHDPDYEFEQPESQLRLEWSNSWDESEDERSRIKLRGKLQLPALSRRLGIVFSGEDASEPGREDDETDDEVGLQYLLAEHLESRLDATLSVSSSDLTPGARYRYRGALADNVSYSFRQRLEWNRNDKVHASSRLNLDYRLADNELVRWSNRAIYGEESDGTEWRSRLSLRQRISAEQSDQPYVLSYFAVIRGVTDPDLTKSYGVGLQARRKVFRKYLFAELEPSYTWRKSNPEDDRDGVWKIVLRFEIALERDLIRKNPDAQN